MRLLEECNRKEPPARTTPFAIVKRLLGFPGMNVLEVAEGDNELVIKSKRPSDRAVPRVWVRAQPQDRTTPSVRDLSCFGRVARLAVLRLRWRCREVLCSSETWTEDVEQLDATSR